MSGPAARILVAVGAVVPTLLSALFGLLFAAPNRALFAEFGAEVPIVTRWVVGAPLLPALLCALLALPAWWAAARPLSRNALVGGAALALGAGGAVVVLQLVSLYLPILNLANMPGE